MSIEPTDINEKEKLIQSGRKHYSEMISIEKEPSELHWECYNHSFSLFANRLADEVQTIGNALLEHAKEGAPIILVSLVRAGVPLGVLLKRHIGRSKECEHYGISIIRGRGIDFAALHYILNKHKGAEHNIYFVDGWTGKGAISKELANSLKDYPELFESKSELPRLVALADLGGCAWLSASGEDWLIPFGILGSVVSGLISRSILLGNTNLNEAKMNFNNHEYWHGCVEYNNLKPHDISQDFVDKIDSLMLKNPTKQIAKWSEIERKNQKKSCVKVIERIKEKYDIDNVNRIKPSIAEATRAVLRRVPDRILLREKDNPNTELLRHFAALNNVPVDVLGEQLGSYHAVTIIKKMD